MHALRISKKKPEIETFCLVFPVYLRILGVVSLGQDSFMELTQTWKSVCDVWNYIRSGLSLVDLPNITNYTKSPHGVATFTKKTKKKVSITLYLSVIIKLDKFSLLVYKCGFGSSDLAYWKRAIIEVFPPIKTITCIL